MGIFLWLSVVSEPLVAIFTEFSPTKRFINVVDMYHVSTTFSKEVKKNYKHYFVENRLAQE
jgi:hypothetical protein